MRAPHELLVEAQQGSRGALARLITYVESGGEALVSTAALAYAAPPPWVVGITGPPGAGKSTLTDRLIAALLNGEPFGTAALSQIGVLCIDPSSPFTGGAILGDRVRMQDHATDPRVYIRSLATRGQLGGLSVCVPDAVRVMGAAGFHAALVETVGVGQMEVDIAAMADTTVVVTNPGWGDAMQANKAGLLEVADIFVINKADRAGLRETRRDLENMLDLGGEREWRPPIIETIAADGRGTAELVEALREHRAFVESHHLAAHRRQQLRRILENVLAATLRQRATTVGQGAAFEAAVEELLRGTTNPYEAVIGLLA